jgi:hypothetical protein
MRTCEVGFWEKERKNCTFEMRERKNRKKDVVRRKSPKREIQSFKENDSDTQRQTQSQVDIICLIFEILYYECMLGFCFVCLSVKSSYSKESHTKSTQ